MTRRVDRNGRVIQNVYDQLDRLTAEEWRDNGTPVPAISISTTTEGGPIDEVQRVGFTADGMDLSGTFTLSFNGATTASLNWNATASEVQSALEALSTIGAGTVAVAQVQDEPTDQQWEVAFQGALAGTNVVQTTVDTSNLLSNFGSVTGIENTQTEGSTGGDETQQVTLSNATGGTFRLAFEGYVTSPLAYDATAAEVDAALEALQSVDAVTVTGNAGGPWSVTFQGTHSGQNVPKMQGDAATASSGTLARTLSFTYDAANQLLTASDPAAEYAFVYDDLGRPTSITHDLASLSFDVVMTQTFDAASNRTQLKATVGSTDDFTNDYAYDALHRMTQVKQYGVQGGNAVAPKRVDFAYDAAGQWDTITRYADLAGTQLVASSTYTFNTLGQLTDLTHAKGANTLADYDWAYDAIGRVTQFVSLTDGTVNYTYDATSQLTGADFTYETDETYSYDANGNRTNTGYSTGTNNRLLSDGTYDYEYDDEGNRIKQTDIATGNYVEFEWDHRNRLTRVTYRDSTGAATKIVEYEYDVFNRRVEKNVDANADQVFEEGVRWVYDGLDVALAYDETGSLTNRYLHGPAIDQILADENSLGELLWPLPDNQGTIRDLAEYDAVTDTTTVANHLTYTAFGAIASQTNATVTTAYAYTGREWDADLSLYYYRNRWYAPNVGQFLSEDPSGFAAGDTNLARYVRNSASNATDPLGLEDWLNNQGYVYNFTPPPSYVIRSEDVERLAVVPGLAPRPLITPVTVPAPVNPLVFLSVWLWPQEAGDAEIRRPPVPWDPRYDGDREGVAIVSMHPGRPLHLSVEVIAGEYHVGTHQVRSDDFQNTFIRSTWEQDPGDVIYSNRSRPIPLTNAPAAMAYQVQLIHAGDLGPYDPITNSCISHVCDVLIAGQSRPLPPPRGSVTQWGYFRSLGFPRPGMPPPPPLISVTPLPYEPPPIPIFSVYDLYEENPTND